jgi:hypothetical protein
MLFLLIGFIFLIMVAGLIWLFYLKFIWGLAGLLGLMGLFILGVFKIQKSNDKTYLLERKELLDYLQHYYGAAKGEKLLHDLIQCYSKSELQHIILKVNEAFRISQERGQAALVPYLKNISLHD